MFDELELKDTVRSNSRRRAKKLAQNWSMSVGCDLRTSLLKDSISCSYDDGRDIRELGAVRYYEMRAGRDSSGMQSLLRLIGINYVQLP